MPESRSSSAPKTPRRNVRGWVAAGAAAAGLMALATAGLAGTAGTANAGDADHAVLLADSYGTRTVVLDGRGGGGSTGGGEGLVSPAPTASAAAAGTAPSMTMQLAYKRTGPDLVLTVSLDGYVYEPLDANNQPVPFPTPATTAIGLGHDLAWGDGTGAKAAASTLHCGKPLKLHRLKDTFSLEHTYPAPGTYNVVYTFLACGLTDGKITATLRDITVK